MPNMKNHGSATMPLSIARCSHASVQPTFFQLLEIASFKRIGNDQPSQRFPIHGRKTGKPMESVVSQLLQKNRPAILAEAWPFVGQLRGSGMVRMLIFCAQKQRCPVAALDLKCVFDLSKLARLKSA